MDVENIVECAQGHRHSGRYGAVGALLRRVDAEGQERYLLAFKGPESAQGGVWEAPGGLRAPFETPEESALRGTSEFGAHNARLAHSSEHGGWAYHLVVADVKELIEPEGMEWFTPAEIEDLPLHPLFREAWNKTAAYYHVAPTKVRDSITQEGLRSEDWQDPPYIWMFNDLDRAKAYQEHSQRFRPQDVWEVNPPGPVAPDPHPGTELTRGNAWVHPGPIPPDNIRRLAIAAPDPPNLRPASGRRYDDRGEAVEYGHPDWEKWGAVTPQETQVLDHLSLSSVASNLHYKFERGTQEPAAILDYAKRLLKLIGYPEDDMHVQAALQAWQTMYPGDQVLQKGPDMAQIEAAPTPGSDQAPATTPTESWGYGTVSSDRLGAVDYAPYDLEEPEDWELPEFQQWHRGVEGKGLIDPKGQLHTWAINDYGEPHHDVVSQEQEIPYVAKVNIHPTGMAAVPSPDSMHLFGIDRPTAEGILAQEAPKHGLRFDNRFVAGVKERCPECNHEMDHADWCQQCGRSTEPTEVNNPDDHWKPWHEQPAGKAKEHGKVPIGNDYVA